MLSKSLRRFLGKATEAYQEQRSPAFWEYVEERGLNEKVVNQFALGECVEPLPGHESFRNHLSIPYVTRTGTIAMKFRALDPTVTPKYNAPAGQALHMYNVAALWSRSPHICIVEGEFDTIAASMAGLNAVGISGTSGWKEHFTRCIDGFGDVFIILDNDTMKEDGSNPGQRAARRLMEQLPNARNILMPQGVDISDYVLIHGFDALHSLVLGTGEADE